MERLSTVVTANRSNNQLSLLSAYYIVHKLTSVYNHTFTSSYLCADLTSAMCHVIRHDADELDAGQPTWLPECS